jgi:hypothetical protein
VLVGGVVAAVVMLAPKGGSTAVATSAPAAERKVWYVTNSGTSPNQATTRATLADAIRVLKSGEDVVILDDTIETGWVSLAKVKDVRIGPAPGKTSTLVYKPGEGRTVAAVIHLTGCENVTLAGLTIDVGGHHDIGVQVSGKSNGVKLDGLTVRNANKHAVNLLNVTAEPDQPLVVSGCRLLLKNGSLSGVHVSGSSDLDCRGVRITNCRFEGNNTGSGVRVEGAANDVDVRNNRLFGLDAGVHFAPDLTPPVVTVVTVEQNTFLNTKVGVKIDQPSGAVRSIPVSRNFFASGTAVTATDPKGLKATTNGRAAGTQPGLSAADEVPGVSIAIPQPADPADKFLRPAAKIVLNGVTLGAE